MAQTPEGKVKDRVKKLLADSKRFGYIHSWWPVPSGYGRSHLDCLGCYRGQFFVVETKAPGKKMTKLQRSVANEVVKAGAVVFVVDGDTQELENWLEYVRENFSAAPGRCHPEGSTHSDAVVIGEGL